MSLKSQIMQNPFIDKLRHGFEIDQQSYENLCQQLRDLREEWRGRDFIDKELAQTLYVMPSIILGMERFVRASCPELLEKLFDMETVIDGLIIDAMA